MKSRVDESARAAERATKSRSQRLLYSMMVPLAIAASLSIGLLLLLELVSASWQSFLKVGAGALFGAVAGGLMAAAWSRSYWSRNMARQIALWRRITDAFFVWLEEVPLPAEALHALQSALDDATADSSRRRKFRP